MEIAIASKYLTGGYKAELVLTADPETIDRFVCRTDRIPPKVLRIFHSGDKGTWTSEDTGKDISQGYVCSHCHEPVIAYISTEPKLGRSPDEVIVDPNNSVEHDELAIVASREIRHIRQLCGCTMVMFDATALPWWSEINSREMWEAIVEGAKQAHRQGGVI